MVLLRCLNTACYPILTSDLDHYQTVLFYLIWGVLALNCVVLGDKVTATALRNAPVNETVTHLNIFWTLTGAMGPPEGLPLSVN